MKKHIFSFIFILISYHFSFAKEYVTGVIILKDKTEKVGFIKTPVLKMGWKNVIKFKDSENDPPEIIEAEEIDFVVLVLDETQHVFKYLQHRKFKRKGEKIVENYAWFYLENMCDKLELYQSVPGFDVNKMNELVFHYRAGDEMAYFYKRPEEERATYLGILFNGGVGIGGSKLNRIILNRYFETEEHMVDKINSGKWDLRNMHDILEYYCTQ